MTVPELLSGYDSEVRKICQELQGLILETLPQAEEIVFEGWKNISYGTGKSHAESALVCYLMPLKNSVNLGFMKGALLKDTWSALTGTGKLMRHLKIKNSHEINKPVIRELLLEAWEERLSN